MCCAAANAAMLLRPSPVQRLACGYCARRPSAVRLLVRESELQTSASWTVEGRCEHLIRSMLRMEPTTQSLHGPLTNCWPGIQWPLQAAFTATLMPLAHCVSPPYLL